MEPKDISASRDKSLHAIATGDRTLLIEAIEEVPELLTLRDAYSNQLIHLAAESDQVQLLRCLIELGGDVNSPGEFGRTPLHIAVQRLSVETTTELLRFPVQIDARDVYRTTPLQDAIASTSIQARTIVGLLLDQGATIDLPAAILLSQDRLVRSMLSTDLSILNEEHPIDILYLAVACAVRAWQRSNMSLQQPSSIFEERARSRYPKAREIIIALLESGVDPNGAPKRTLPPQLIAEEVPEILQLFHQFRR